MKLFFRKTGKGKPLIILHGLFGMSDNWSALSKQFAENGYLVYAVDVRNHGRSPHSYEFDFSVMSDDVIRLMNDENLTQATLLGHSMGAKIAMWCACKNGSRVSALIAADMAPRAYTPHHQGVFAAIHSLDLQHTASRKEAEARLRETLQDQSTVQFLLKNLYWDDQEKLAWRFHLSGIEKNIESIGIALPDEFRYDGKTLFLRGEKSGYVTTADVAGINRHFPHAVLETVTGAGHWVHAENPAGFLKAVLDFLK